MSTLRVLGVSGSLRAKSTNTGMLRYAKANAPKGMSIEIADLSQIPFYNADIKEKPASVKALLEKVDQADALVLGSTEYNYSIAPALKNALDWASREPDNAILSGKPVAMMGAGGGMGTARSQYHLRQVCVFLNLFPLNRPEVFANAFTGGFDEDGNLIDERIQGLIRDQMVALMDYAKTIKK